MNSMAHFDESTVWTVVDISDRFGALPVSRICLDPLPGSATEKDVIALEASKNRLFELVDGVLVEKAMGFYEAYIASLLVTYLTNYTRDNDLGIVAGADGMVRLAPGLVRIPDAAFVSWQRLPDRVIPRDPIPNLVPDLAVEIISKGNTAEEMDRKLRDYFQAGVNLVWYVQPATRSIEVYSSATSFSKLQGHDCLDGGKVLPGFQLQLDELFREPEPR